MDWIFTGVSALLFLLTAGLAIASQRLQGDEPGGKQ
jgi:hypothetical protein